MADATPTEFANVDQPFQAAEVDKRAEVAQVGDEAANGVAGAQADENIGALARLGGGGALGQDQSVLLGIQLDHPQLQRLADAGDECIAAGELVGNGWEFQKLAGGHESPQAAPFDQQAAAVEAGHQQFDDFVVVHDALHLVPVGLDVLFLAVGRAQHLMHVGVGVSAVAVAVWQRCVGVLPLAQQRSPVLLVGRRGRRLQLAPL